MNANVLSVIKGKSLVAGPLFFDMVFRYSLCNATTRPFDWSGEDRTEAGVRKTCFLVAVLEVHSKPKQATGKVRHMCSFSTAAEEMAH